MSLAGFFTGLFIGLTCAWLVSQNIANPETSKRFSFIPEPRYVAELPPLPTRHRSEKGESVLCWLPILKYTDISYDRIRLTWGQHCDALYFVAKDDAPEFGVVGHHYERKTRDLWNQVQRGWAKMAELHLEEYDWFVKLDSDSFFSPDNFIGMTKEKQWNSTSLLYFGHTLIEQSRHPSLARAHFNIGAGYGVSQALLRALAPYFPNYTDSIVPQEQRCPHWIRWGEDVKFGDCLRIAFPDFLPNLTRDDHGRERFLPYTPGFHFTMTVGGRPDWYWKGKDLNKIGGYHKCCSPRHVLWHHLKNRKWFYVLYYTFYEMEIDPMNKAEYDIYVKKAN